MKNMQQILGIIFVAWILLQNDLGSEIINFVKSWTMRSDILAENICFQVSACELIEEIAGEKVFNSEIMMRGVSF